MRTNPCDDWRIDDLKTIAKRHGFSTRQRGTSHVIFSYRQYKLTVPSHKPIKPVYTKKFISMLDIIIEEQNHGY